ncbi:MAG: LPS assembly lipoprotein LptE [Puniceicoccales bacterium]|jgi:hypothetical protein|nr:LPS assembly lipoprotein LptE [Puniceicoccales bacterium]
MSADPENRAAAGAKPRPALRSALTAIACAVLSLTALTLAALPLGCGHYHLGTGNKVPFRTIALAPVVNDSAAPSVQALLHAQLADALAAESGITLVSDPDNADALLRVRLTRYTTEVLATDPTDTGLGTSFTLTLTARSTLENRRATGGGKPWFKDRVTRASAVAHAPPMLADASGSTRAGTGGFGAVETQTITVLTRDLARKITGEVVSVW